MVTRLFVYYIWRNIPQEEPVTSTMKKCIPLFVALVLAVPALVGSTTLLRLGVERMSKDAEIVVRGHVSWDYAVQPDPDGAIYSLTGVEVDRCIAGDCPESVELRHRGGTVGDLTLYIPGMPRFTPGQEVILFLEPDYEKVPGYHSVLGMVQGFFVVVTEPVTGTKLAVQQLGGVTIAAPDENGSIAPVAGVSAVIGVADVLEDRIVDARSKKGGGQ